MHKSRIIVYGTRYKIFIIFFFITIKIKYLHWVIILVPYILVWSSVQQVPTIYTFESINIMIIFRKKKQTKNNSLLFKLITNYFKGRKNITLTSIHNNLYRYINYVTSLSLTARTENVEKPRYTRARFSHVSILNCKLIRRD